MDKRQAEQAGYHFSGIYEGDKEVAKKRAKQERGLGNKAIVVYEAPSKYSRSSSGGGYSVYIIKSEANRELEKKQATERHINSLLHTRNKHIADIEMIDVKLKELGYIQATPNS